MWGQCYAAFEFTFFLHFKWNPCPNDIAASIVNEA